MSPLEELFAPYGAHLTVEQLAEVLGVKASTAYKWLQEARIPGYKVGGTWVILREEVRDHLERNRNIPRAGDSLPPPSGGGGTAE